MSSDPKIKKSISSSPSDKIDSISTQINRNHPPLLSQMNFDAKNIEQPKTLKNSSKSDKIQKSIETPNLFQRVSTGFLGLMGRKSAKPVAPQLNLTDKIEFRPVMHELLAPADPLLRGKPPSVPLVHTSDEFFAAHGESSARRTLFWVSTTAQDKTIWGLADTGSCRNLINFDFSESLPIKGTMFPPVSITVIAGDGNTLDLVGWTVLKL